MGRTDFFKSRILKKGGFSMLGFWRSHADYQSFVRERLAEIMRVLPTVVLEYENEISKLWILNLDPLKTIIAPLYAPIGRPSELQPEIFRSLLLMNALGFSLDEWVFRKLPANPALRTVCGFADKLPGVASYYDFVSRIVAEGVRARQRRRKRQPDEKPGKGHKLPPKHPGVVRKLVEKLLAGRRFGRRPERVLQEIFARVAVQPSVDLGLVPQSVSVSGDGTCVKTGASHFGRKTCDCKSKGVYNCDCPRRFADPNATWGWDSHNAQWFYGYTGYFISAYNKAEKLDLPLYLRLVEASRHDSVSAVVALAEFLDLYPNLKIAAFMSDSASDNQPTYELLNAWGINAVIALNPTNSGNFTYPKTLSINENGVPICPGGNLMANWGYNAKDRNRIKWRCPRVLGRTAPCAACDVCSDSAYGRVVYTKPSWDLRLFTTIARGSERWKLKMKERTAAERVNNRILNHYGVETAKYRGKARISFFITVAAFNIHLDARLAKLKKLGKFSFVSVAGLPQTA